MPMSIVIAVGALLVAIILFVFGLRGRRVNEHPVCRRCGFDVAGVYPGIGTCPECGAELAGKRAVRVGVRRRLAWLVGIGGAGMVVTAAGIVLLVAASVLGTPNHHKPVWWLLMEANGTQDSVAHAALDELNARLRAGVVSEAAEARIVTRALAVQGDPNATWRTGWGDFVEGVYLSGRLPEADWRAYAEGAFRVELAARERVRVGDPVPFEWVLTRRTSHRTLLAAGVSSHGTWLGDEMIWFVNDQLVVQRDMIGGHGPAGSRAATDEARWVFAHPIDGGTQIQLPDRYAKAPGRETVYSRLVLSILEIADPSQSSGGGSSWGRGMGGELPFARTDEPDWLNEPVDGPLHPRTTTRTSAMDGFNVLVHKRLELRAEVEVVPDTVETIEFVRDPRVIEDVVRELSEKARPGFNTMMMGLPEIDLKWRGEPELVVGGAFEVFWRVGGRDVHVGDLLIHASDQPVELAGRQVWTRRLIPEDDLLDIDVVDLIFRPSVELARNTMRMRRIVGEEIVLPGVALDRPSRPTRGAWIYRQPVVVPRQSHTLLLELVRPMRWNTVHWPRAFTVLALRPPFVYVMSDVGTLHSHRIPEQTDFRKRPPNQRGAIVNGGDGAGLVVFGDHLIASMHGGIRIHDLSDPAEPRLVATRMPEQEHRTRALLVHGSEVLVVTERGLLRHDLSDPTESRVGVEAVELLGADAEGILFNATVHGGRLITIERPTEFDGDEHATIGVYDLDDPSGVRRVGRYVHDARLAHVLGLDADVVAGVGGTGLVLLDVSAAGGGEGAAESGDPVVMDRHAVFHRAAARTHAHGRTYFALDGELFVLDGQGLRHLEEILPTRSMPQFARWFGVPRGDGHGDLLAGINGEHAFVIRVQDPAGPGAGAGMDPGDEGP